MRRYFIVMVLLVTLVDGDEISLLISQIKSAPASQKRVLTNQLKQKLRHTNKQTRQNAIEKLRGRNHPKHQRKRVHIIKAHNNSQNLKTQQNKHQKRIHE